MKKVIALILSMLLVISIMPAALAANAVNAAMVTVDSGKLLGLENNGVYSFLGIPYAKAERFQQPERNEPWDGVRTALTYGAVCPQDRTLAATYNVNPYEFMSISGNDMVGNEENCLNVNVWTSGLESTAKKPVLVFMHGGGLSNGASSELAYYDGEYFAKQTDSVFVSVNMRLNYLGFLDVSAYGGKEYANSVNAGLADMVLALEWVRDNISVFGGDPSNVTILGQSGGGTKVTSLACLPSAVGLFKRVAIISGGYTTNTKEKAAANTEKLVAYLGLTSTDDVIGTLTSMSYEELYNAGMASGATFGVAIDGDYFPAPWYDAETGKMSEIAASYTYMIGSVFAETGPNQINFVSTGTANLDYYKPMMTEESIKALITNKYGDKAEAAKEAFQKAYPNHDVVDVVWLNNRTRTMGQMNACKTNNVPVYSYVVAYEQPIYGWLCCGTHR